MSIQPADCAAGERETAVRETFRDAGFFVLRTPLLPAAAFHRWSSGLSAAVPGLAGDTLEAALANDRSLLRERLAEIVDEPAVREAIFIASPSLSNSLRYWRADPDSKRGQRVEHSLVSYFGRMCVRSTPFGLFSGCSMGRVEGASALVLRGRADHRRVTRIDKAYLFAVCEDLRQDASLCQELLYTPNSSLYRLGAYYRYAQAVVDSAGLTHRLVEVERSELLETMISRAAEKATAGELVAALVAADPEGGITAEDAHAFVSELIDAQVLVSDLTPNVTGDEPADEIVRQLRQLPAQNTARLASRLEIAQRRLSALDEHGLGAPLSLYQDILPGVSELSELLPATLLRTWPEERLFQVDLLPAEGTLTISRDLAARILAGAELLHRICARTRHVGLERFRDAFIARYHNREVPLLEALDDDAGIGFGRSESPNIEASPLLDGIVFPPEEKTSNVHWGQREEYLYRRLCAAWMAGEREIVLGPADILGLSSEEPLPLPDAFSVVASVVGSPEDLRSGDPRLHVKWIDGPSGARTIGRFCHIHGALREAVQEYLRDEEANRPAALFAEIVHLPQGRSANVVCRPVLRGHELTFLGRSGAPENRQIPAADLLVSVVDGRIRLRSQRLDREVVPRLTSAHNPEWRGLSVYKFLIALQRQESWGPIWSWGPFESAPFLPRVTSGRVILALAQWRLTKDQIAPLIAESAAGRLVAVQRMRRDLGLPRVAAVASGDEFIPVDFENPLCVDTFVHLGSKDESTVIRELLPAPDELCVESPEGLLAHELVLPFVRERRAQAAETVLPGRVGGARAAERAIQRRFGPGSSWLDARLYCTKAGADRLLQQLVAPLVDLGVAEPWFFLRDRDPEFHLRVRFCGAPDRLHDELLPALERLSGGLLESDDLSRLALDTYEREVERYGGPEGIELAERLFSIDSEAALALLALPDTADAADPADVRWLLALRGSDLLLDDLGLDLQSKVELTRQLTDRYFAELRGDDKLRQSLGHRFRASRAKLAALWDPAGEEGGWLGPALSALERRVERARPVAEELRRRSRDGQLTSSVPDLARSFLHMHARRLFSSAMRAHELVTCDLLHRFYESRLARRGGMENRMRDS